jgi:hypothetical protein
MNQQSDRALDRYAARKPVLQPFLRPDREPHSGPRRAERAKEILVDQPRLSCGTFITIESLAGPYEKQYESEDASPPSRCT